mmetsp:Transcript_17097/g.28945  ORF Transcript_17097/g.28945 Transcript_17097/m.28945 type:complete len:322 (-) Transcript_17097:2207-3172(-)|eukprot:CAMPEP_0175019402 /NCGR_PEP_ID=MMETSP0005-20121125/13536_1 /TAXON_ID=420556 /ORGANISM="Ochromonas sp., Strain CCMP1393" /LENGTH=321 /DNA_ID=CAMNT_0016277129 /DNA_START=2395 /DNA_END=3360 /DNA_ORIENTATION=-
MSGTAVAELRAALPGRISNELSDADLARFLRARSQNVAKATEMINKWDKWWNSALPGTESLLPKDSCTEPDAHEEVYRELMPHSNLGEDKEGRPIYWEKTGLISNRMKEVKKHLTEDQLFVRHVRQQEIMIRRLRAKSEKYGRPIEKQILVMDVKNVSIQMDFVAMNVFKRSLQIDESCYPERLQTMFMINAPALFTVLWSLVKPWIDPVTVQKIRILGSNYQDVLKEFIDEDHIPVEYGGTKEDMHWTFPESLDIDVSSLRGDHSTVDDAASVAVAAAISTVDTGNATIMPSPSLEDAIAKLKADEEEETQTAATISVLA